MSESIPQSVLDQLPEGCRKCPVALFLLEGMAALPALDEDPTDTAEHISEVCDGYQGDEPPTPVVEAEGRPIVMMSSLTDENCPYVQTLGEL
jgi:hypothetical protein